MATWGLKGSWESHNTACTSETPVRNESGVTVSAERPKGASQNECRSSRQITMFMVKPRGMSRDGESESYMPCKRDHEWKANVLLSPTLFFRVEGADWAALKHLALPKRGGYSFETWETSVSRTQGKRRPSKESAYLSSPTGDTRDATAEADRFSTPD